MVLVCKRLLKEGKTTIDGLRAYVTRADNARQLEDVTAEQASEAQEASSMASFDAAYRQWYTLQLEANRWVNGSSRRRGDEIYMIKSINKLKLFTARTPRGAEGWIRAVCSKDTLEGPSPDYLCLAKSEPTRGLR